MRPSYDDSELIIAGIYLVLNFVILAMVPAMWRDAGQQKIEAAIRPVWLWGERSLRGVIRIMVPGVVFNIFGALVILVDAYRHVLPAAHAILSPIAITGVTGSFLLVVTTFVWGRPKFLVPPLRRNDPSLFGAVPRGPAHDSDEVT